MDCQYCHIRLPAEARICPACGAHTFRPATGPTQRLLFARLPKRAAATPGDLARLRRVVVGHHSRLWWRLAWVGINLAAFALAYCAFATIITRPPPEPTPRILIDAVGVLVVLIFVTTITLPFVAIFWLWPDRSMPGSVFTLEDTIVGAFLGLLTGCAEGIIFTHSPALSYLLFNHVFVIISLVPLWLIMVGREQRHATTRWRLTVGIATFCGVAGSWWANASLFDQLPTLVAWGLTGVLCGLIYACLTLNLLPWVIQGQHGPGS